LDQEVTLEKKDHSEKDDSLLQQFNNAAYLGKRRTPNNECGTLKKIRLTLKSGSK